MMPAYFLGKKMLIGFCIGQYHYKLKWCLVIKPRLIITVLTVMNQSTFFGTSIGLSERNWKKILLQIKYSKNLLAWPRLLVGFQLQLGVCFSFSFLHTIILIFDATTAYMKFGKWSKNLITLRIYQIYIELRCYHVLKISKVKKNEFIG